MTLPRAMASVAAPKSLSQLATEVWIDSTRSTVELESPGEAGASVDDEVGAGEDEEDRGQVLDVPHRRAQHVEQAGAGEGERDRERGEHQPHPEPVDDDREHAAGDAVVGQGGEDAGGEEGQRAPDRGDGVGDAVEEHRHHRPVVATDLDAGHDQARAEPEQPGDAEHHEQHSDDEAEPAGLVGEPGDPRLEEHPDHEEDDEEAGAHRRPDGQGAGDAGPLRAGTGTLDAEEEHQVGRQQDETARVDRRQHAEQEVVPEVAFQAEQPGAHQPSSSAIVVRRVSAVIAPWCSEAMCPSAVTKSVAG